MIPMHVFVMMHDKTHGRWLRLVVAGSRAALGCLDAASRIFFFAIRMPLYNCVIVNF